MIKIKIITQTESVKIVIRDNKIKNNNQTKTDKYYQ